MCVECACNISFWPLVSFYIICRRRFGAQSTTLLWRGLADIFPVTVSNDRHQVYMLTIGTNILTYSLRHGEGESQGLTHRPEKIIVQIEIYKYPYRPGIEPAPAAPATGFRQLHAPHERNIVITINLIECISIDLKLFWNTWIWSKIYINKNTFHSRKRNKRPKNRK